MEKIFIVAAAITAMFVFAKVIEMKFIEKEWKPLKFVIRDAVVVFFCGAAGLLGYTFLNHKVSDFMNVITDSKAANLATTEIFTDEPGF